jgi:hypothetical protein
MPFSNQRIVYKLIKIRVLFLAIILSGSFLWSEQVPLKNIQLRKDTKKSISLFQPWETIVGGIFDTTGLSSVQKLALHDLIHHAPDFYKLKWKTTPGDTFKGNAIGFTSQSIEDGLKFRNELLAINPNIILIGEVRYFGAHKSYLPADHKFWLRDAKGVQVPGFSKDYFRLDFDNVEFQFHVSAQCKALLETGVVDGCLLDALSDEKYNMVAKIRETIGADGIIIGNVNRNVTPKITPLLNGIYMEAGWWGLEKGRQVYWDELQKVISSNQQNLREPKLICTEVWPEPAFQDTLNKTEIHPDQLKIMRAGLALLYTHSQGYFSFYPKSLGEHRHVYHHFLNASLGLPKADSVKMIDGAYFKEWERATVVFNPMLNKDITITFKEPRKSQKTNIVGLVHALPVYDGDIFLKGDFKQVYPDEKSRPTHIEKLGARQIKWSVTNNIIYRERSILIQKPNSGSGWEYFNTKGKKVK